MEVSRKVTEQDLQERSDHEERELHLYADNHADLHRQRTSMVHKNLRNKMASGTYDSNKAHRAFVHVAKDAAGRYDKEHNAKGGRTFNKDHIHNVAKKMRDRFEDEAKNGEHDHLLHKKHQKKTKSEDVELDNDAILETVELTQYEEIALRIIEDRQVRRFDDLIEEEILEEGIEVELDEDAVIEKMIEAGYSDEEIAEAIEELQITEEWETKNRIHVVNAGGLRPSQFHI